MAGCVGTCDLGRHSLVQLLHSCQATCGSSTAVLLPALCERTPRGTLLRCPPRCCRTGVDTDLEESQEVLKFAKQLEIVDKAEAGNLKVHCCAASPPPALRYCHCLHVQRSSILHT